MTDLVRDEKYSAKRRIVSAAVVAANAIEPIEVALEKLREQRHIHTPRRWTDPFEPYIDDLSEFRAEGEADNTEIHDWCLGGAVHVRCTEGIFNEMMARRYDKPKFKPPPITKKQYG